MTQETMKETAKIKKMAELGIESIKVGKSSFKLSFLSILKIQPP